ncbi:MAG TPA: Hsp70 family protein, partial [Alphaproteobacteria bacterium]|nr:Hsp70 family protein [Alphaproteobacteria bacterium]
KKRRELVEARNQGDSLIYATEKSLKDLADKLPADEKTKVEDAIADLRKALENDEVEEIKAKTETLAQASMKLGELLYKAQQESADSDDAKPSHDGEAEVVDADFTEVKDDKKSA